MSTAITTDDLPQLVGYAELQAKYGWEKRVLQRWVQKGRLLISHFGAENVAGPHDCAPGCQAPVDRRSFGT